MVTGTPEGPKIDFNLTDKYANTELTKVNDITQFKHGSDLGREPEHVKGETFKAAEKIDTGRVQARKIEKYKLDELTEDYYMFSMAPVYFMIPIKVDLIYQFGKDLSLDRIKDVITYQAQSAMFAGLGEWGHVLQGIPKVHKSLFKTWAEQLVFPDRTKVPNQYWRLGIESVSMLTPGVISTSAPIDVYLPSGVDCSFNTVRRVNGTFGFKKQPPETWVVEEAYRFFTKVGG